MLILSVSSDDSRRHSGNLSPLTPSPRSEMRGIRLFRAISRKLGRRSHQGFRSTDESRSSSSDSSCSTSMGHTSRIEDKDRSVSPNSSSSDSGSDVQTLRSRHHHSTSAESLKRVFQNLNLYSRSQSCTNSKELKKKKEKKVPKSILRHPTSYTYAKGLSGLPTQRIPRTRGYSACSCSMHYLSNLNR
ncbi:uncharacterized protein LOC109541858 [Dendroctonus ponderosae]|uniref:DUF4797 domain-containing protein n=1 Tax=Dendroctonus ponderosae TaxID=77166 RepID=A0AAR5PZM9_DENPD|nr:uncharacterized protein LOC109541858 [Dendroctonus ponderosae]KAH1002391.1 hypothetical protein HUJ04_008479 [Dendroctonus ponderosae]KAH1008385.1 hypothetical protein HUJ05_008940 [Dendroctonus ponderosae]